MSHQEAESLIDTDEPDKVAQGLAMLKEPTGVNPDDAVAWFRYGGGLDRSGDEAAAIVAYERVFEIGVEQLDPSDQPRIYVQAGSTLRNLGRLDEARELLEEGRRRFPDLRVLAVFQSFVEVSAGRDREAVNLLLDVILAEGSGDESLTWYPRSLAYYAGEIRGATDS